MGDRMKPFITKGGTGRIFSLCMGLLLVLVFVAPFLWMLATSLRSNSEMFGAMEPGELFWPRHFNWGNYREIFTQIPFARYLLNSLVTALGSALLETSLASLAGFGLVIHGWKGRERVRRVLVLSWLIPFSVVLVPRFLLVTWLPDLLWPSDFWAASRVISLGGVEYPVGRLAGLDSFFTLIVPGSVSITATFLLMTAMERISPDILDSAYLDTGSSLRVFRHIVLPLVGPSLVTVAFIAFLSSWQSFTWPLIVTSTSEMQTATLGLRAFQTLHSTQWPLLMAGSVVLALPSLAFLLLAQGSVVDRHRLHELNEHRL